MSTSVPRQANAANQATKQASADLQIRFGQRSHQDVAAADLLDDVTVNAVVKRCNGAEADPRIVVRNLLAWPDESRWALLATLQQIGRSYQIRSWGRGNAVFTDPFRYILSLVEGPDEPERCERSRRAGVEAVAMFHANNLTAACNCLANSLRQKGIRALRVQTLIHEARSLIGEPRAKLDPTAEARRFFDHVASTCSAGGEVPILRFWREDFYVWETLAWKRLDIGALRAMITEFLQRGDARGITSHLISDVVANLQGLCTLPSWDVELPAWIDGESVAPSRFVAFANGLIDIDQALNADGLSNVQRYESDPRHFSTVSLPFEFDPEAQCPLWLQSLGEILPPTGRQDRRIQVLQEYFGSCLIPNDLRFEKFLVLVGNGRNGKSTLLSTLTELLGQANVSHVSIDHLNHEFRVVDMVGKLANIVSEMSYVDRVAEGRLKELVTGDRVQINRKHKSPITLVPSAKLIFATNTLPAINDRTEGVWRRMIAMPFLVKFTDDQIDRNRRRDLQRELAGILNWCLEGARRLYRRQEFSACTVCETCLNGHRFASDPFLQFLDEKTIRGEHCCVKSETLYSEYANFCKENGRKQRCSAEFGKQLLCDESIQKQRRSGPGRPYFYTGIALSPAVATAAC